jgi:hypothetical protein
VIFVVLIVYGVSTLIYGTQERWLFLLFDSYVAHACLGCSQLVVSPPVISTGTFITVLRMLSVMCANCPDLAFTLLRQNIAETLCYLLTGSGDANMDEVLL